MHQPSLRRGLALAALLAVTLGACSSTASPSPTATGSPTPTPIGDRIALDRTPANTGCDAIGVSYTSVTFHIDATAAPQVWAVTNEGARLGVRWDSTFTGGPLDDPSVLDKGGAVVARDGEALAIPQGAWPNLHGHFVCPAVTELFVLDQAPA